MTRTTVYLCDGKRHCAGAQSCKVNGGAMDLCEHTLRAEHALYGEELHPEDHPERFTVVEVGDNIMYVEAP